MGMHMTSYGEINNWRPRWVAPIATLVNSTNRTKLTEIGQQEN